MLDVEKIKKSKVIATINCEPKWEDLFPLYSDWIRYGTSEQKELVIKALGILVKVGDMVRQTQKQGKKTIEI